jgi:hypothetical protein
MMKSTKVIEVRDGMHGLASFTDRFLQPLFAAGTITPYPGADYYAVCWGELCAYADRPADGELGQAGQQKLLATWSREIPGCAEDMPAMPGPFNGEWSPSK